MKKFAVVLLTAALSLSGLAVQPAHAVSQTITVDCSRQYQSLDATSPNTSVNVTLERGDTLTVTNTTTSGNGFCNTYYTSLTLSDYFSAYPTGTITGDQVYTVRTDSPALVNGRIAIFTTNIGAGASNGRQVYVSITAPVSRSVTFSANGGTGSMTTQSGTSAATLTANTFVKTGFTFNGWNTAANGSGTSYGDAASYAFSASTTLYAQWLAQPVSQTVTFDANGGTGSMIPQSGTSAAALTANAFALTGSSFAGWNTAANGSGTAYADASSYAFSASTTLYAQWTANPQPVVPVAEPVVGVSGIEKSGSTRLISGTMLSTVSKVLVDGKPVEFMAQTDGSLKIKAPELTAGRYDIQMFSPRGLLTWQEGLVVLPEPVKLPSGAGISPSETRSISGFSGDSPLLSQQLMAQIRLATANAASIKCEGGVFSTRETAANRKLAYARAVAACSYAAALNPSLKTEVSRTVTLGLGQAARKVIIEIQR
jgi:uncharacterized repeat protein (TIGR02543 family)